jgi:Do/DeqQ family serine protease
MNLSKIMRSRIFLIAVFSFLFTGLGFLIGTSIRSDVASLPDAVPATTGNSARLVRSDPELGSLSLPSFREVVQEVLPTVVEIDVVTVVQAGDSPFNFFGRNPGSMPREFRQQGLGSGVIVQRTGNRVYVLTNNHVVGDADEISVTLNDGREFNALLVGGDPKKDLALVVFETREDVPVARLGDSDNLYAGDWVLAVGNPLGFESTVTAGIVSAIGRDNLSDTSIAGFTDYIQTDAAINQGNSGGALVNSAGEVIGINTWIASPSGGNIGIGFAVPINNARKTINDFISKGKVEYGWLGISVGDPIEGLAGDLDLEDVSGAFVYGVFKSSPGDKAGLKPGDYITEINDEEIRNYSHLLRTVSELVPGEVSEFEILRGDETLNLSVKLRSRGTEEEIAELSKLVWPGFTVVPMTDALRQELNAQSGKVVIVTVEPESSADVAGLRPGDILREINGSEIESVRDFYNSVNDGTRRELSLSIDRQGSRFTVGLMK